MDVEVTREKPVFIETAPYDGYDGMDGRIEIYMDMLLEAEIGDEWTLEDQDCYPNREEVWTDVVRKVYEDEFGILLIETYDGADFESRAIWVEKRRR